MIRVYIITHKLFSIPEIDGYIPLLVGAINRPELKKKYLSDDTGDNLSLKNDSYCELTGLYWIWKNTTHEIVGLVHYRRYFADVFGYKFKSRYFVKNRRNAYKILTIEDLKRILDQYDLIVKESEVSRFSNEEVFRKHAHVGNKNWDRLESLIRDYAPEYLDYFKIMARDYKHINCNMFVGKKIIIDKYCTWLFAILEKMDQINIYEEGQRYKNREMGYFAEILFGVWLLKNQITYTVTSSVNLATDDIEDAMLHWTYLPVFFLKSIMPLKLKNYILERRKV